MYLKINKAGNKTTGFGSVSNEFVFIYCVINFVLPIYNRQLLCHNTSALGYGQRHFYFGTTTAVYLMVGHNSINILVQKPFRHLRSHFLCSHLQIESKRRFMSLCNQFFGRI